MTEYLQVLTTVDTREGASAIARKLLEMKLAACVQVAGPVTSSYWWNGAIESAEEWYCLIKTAANKYEEVEKTIRTLHPYEEPEIVALPIAAGSKTYLEWVGNIVNGS